MVINHNLLAENAQRQLKINAKRKNEITEKLASGYRINRSADNAAGLSISEKMRGQIRGLNRASANVQDAISLVQVADGALNEDHDILQRMRELAVQAANDTNTYEDRGNIQKEMNQLISELDRIAETTAFNDGIYPLKRFSSPDLLLVTDSPKIDSEAIEALTTHSIDLSSLSDGNYSGYSKSGDTITVSGTDNYVFSGSYSGASGKIVVDSNAVITLSSDINMDISVNAGKDAVILSAPYTEQGLGYPVKAGKVTVGEGSTLTIKLDPEEYTRPLTGIEFEKMQLSSNATVNIEGSVVKFTTTSETGIERAQNSTNTTINMYYDTDNHSSSYLKANKLDVNKVNISSGTLILSDAESALSEDTEINIPDGSLIWARSAEEASSYMLYANYEVEEGEKNLGIWIQAGANSQQSIYMETVDASASGLGIQYISVMSHESASSSIGTIDNAIERVSTHRSYYGAMQNRFEHVIAVNDNTAENLQNAESKIRDSDMAKEMMELTKLSILEQVGTSMLSQANQDTQGILNLLK